MYIIINNDTGEFEVTGSIKATAKHTAIKTSTLYEQFSRKKKTEFELKNWFIQKKEIIKSKRNES